MAFFLFRSKHLPPIAIQPAWAKRKTKTKTKVTLIGWGVRTSNARWSPFGHRIEALRARLDRIAEIASTQSEDGEAVKFKIDKKTA